MKALVLTLLFLLIAPSVAKIFSRCELASVLKQNGLGSYTGELDKWLCYAYFASKFNTEAVNGRYYGIFQIGSSEWCTKNKNFSIHSCYKKCSAFTDDDITDDISCAKRIAQDHVPLNYFWPWIVNCRGKNMSKWSRGCRLFD